MRKTFFLIGLLILGIVAIHFSHKWNLERFTEGEEVEVEPYELVIECESVGDVMMEISADGILTFYSKGKRLVLDFSGDKLTYSGSLPMDESAKIFFECVFFYVKEAVKIGEE